MSYRCNKEPKFDCDYCDYKCYKKSDIVRHLHCKHYHSLFSCKKCNKKFTYESAKKVHERNCGVPMYLRKLPMRFFCDHCDYKTYYKNCIQYHVQAKHLNLAKRKKNRTVNKTIFLRRKKNSKRCSKCQKKFFSKKNLFKHIKICGLVPDKLSCFGNMHCDHCEYKTYLKASMARHMQGHLARNIEI